MENDLRSGEMDDVRGQEATLCHWKRMSAEPLRLVRVPVLRSSQMFCKGSVVQQSAAVCSMDALSPVACLLLNPVAVTSQGVLGDIRSSR